MTEKLESFSRNSELPMTTENILREARMLKGVMIKETKPKEEEHKLERQEDSDTEGGGVESRAFNRTGTELIETDDEIEVGSPERAEESDEDEDQEHFSSRPLDFTTTRRMSDESNSEGEEYFR